MADAALLAAAERQAQCCPGPPDCDNLRCRALRGVLALHGRLRLMEDALRAVLPVLEKGNDSHRNSMVPVLLEDDEGPVTVFRRRGTECPTLGPLILAIRSALEQTGG